MLVKRDLAQGLNHIQDDLCETISLFGALSECQLSQLLDYTTEKVYHAGERLFSQGDLPGEIYILCCGRVDLVVQKNGIFNIEASLQRGDSIGESALIGIQPQVGSAMVVGGDATLLVLSREALLSLYQKDIELYGLLMMNIAREVSRKLHHMIQTK